jgi:hypothetical protein
MSAETLAKKYIVAMEQTLENSKKTEVRFEINEKDIDEILSYISSYLNDAKYFFSEQKFETSLTSIAYCEGLLDALKLLGAIKIEGKN